jgi:hypothetical protein
MNICYGHRPRPFSLTATRRYHDEEILDMIERVRAAGHAVFLRVENCNIPLRPEELRLAAAAAAAYHNQIAYNAPSEDEWEEEYSAAMETAGED